MWHTEPDITCPDVSAVLGFIMLNQRGFEIGYRKRYHTTKFGRIELWRSKVAVIP